MGVLSSNSRLSADLLAEVVSWRHDLHQHPELAFNERRTSEFVASRLAQFGLAVHRGLGGTGVIGTLTRGTSRRVIGVRADMDALPIQEQSGASHASQVPGVMHACGHDGHVSMALAAARLCAEMPDLDGTVHFIFQPAEEAEGGARRMIEEGLFQLFPCDAVYAMHNWPTLPLGTCVVRDTTMAAAMGLFEITISGRGCHGAMPHQGTDSILAAAHLITSLQTIVSRNVDPLQSAVLSATQIHAGDSWNVIPDTCIIRGTTRWFDDGIGEIIERRVCELSKRQAAAFGCEATVRYEHRFPATINHPDAARFVRSVASDPTLGLRLVDAPPAMGSEDFAFMLKVVPGCYLMLGSGSTGNAHGLHSSHYDFNDELLPIGVEFWVALIRKSLVNEQTSIPQ
jgi:amidohydrolase